MVVIDYDLMKMNVVSIDSKTWKPQSLHAIRVGVRETVIRTQPKFTMLSGCEYTRSRTELSPRL